MSKRAKKTGRGCYVGPPAIFALSQACYFIAEALGDTCYLVGSATQSMDYRDVDIRVLMADEKFDVLFGGKGHGTELCAFWSLFNTSVSYYLRAITGLPVDFQVQRRTEANARYEGAREPIGLFFSPQSVGPEWRKETENR